LLNIRLAFSRTNTDISVRSVPFPLIIPHYSILRDLLFPLPIFALQRFPFPSLSILYTCIFSFSFYSAVAACGIPIVYDLHLCDFLPLLIPLSISSFQSVGRPVVIVFVPLFFPLAGPILHVSVHSFTLCQLTIFLTSAKLLPSGFVVWHAALHSDDKFSFDFSY
jgi:hypothetical protein